MRNSTLKNGFFILGIISILLILYSLSHGIGNNQKEPVNKNNQIKLLHNLIITNQEELNLKGNQQASTKEEQTKDKLDKKPVDNQVKNESKDIDPTEIKESNKQPNTIPAMEKEDLSYNNYLILVNKKNPISADYQPPDLIQPNIPFNFDGDSPKKLMRQKAAQALEKMFAKAKEENVPLVAQSGYRSYQTQEAIFTFNQSRYGFEEANKVSAVAGQSEHQTGLAIDVSDPSITPDPLVIAFGETKSGIWLANNAAQFGFIIRYPEGKEDITGYQYEPWHIRYVGEETATLIKNNNWTLEEFWENQKN